MDTISGEKLQAVQAVLDSIEQNSDVTVIHAVESGSRAWGFPSQNSDYDIRFIYHHPVNWYLSAFEKPDSINPAIESELDAAGWDIAKCLRLLHKGNAPLYEWLFSPIVYRQDTAKLEPLRELAHLVFNPKAAAYHYLALAKKKLSNEQIFNNAKSFLYALRALLCTQWIKDENSPPPVHAWPLFERYLSGQVLEETTLLIERKRSELESDRNNIAPSLMVYSNSLYSSLAEADIPVRTLKDNQLYDQVLLKILSGVA